MPAEDDCESVPKTGEVSVETAEERARWSRAFSISEATLVKAVQLVGPSVEALRQLFCRD